MSPGQTMRGRIAVLTDAGSPEFLFPLWRRYYGGLFGEENLYVLTYTGQKQAFAGSGLANLLEIGAPYADALRAKLISDLAGMLLGKYDVVIRCDVDEFLLPAPDKYENLADYAARCPLPYVTARGVDLVEQNSDAPLNINAPVLPQRPWGLRSTALYKTCLVRRPVRWGGGFHGADVPPSLDELYLFHLKWSDVARQIAWHETMRAGLTPGSKEYDYFNMGAAHLREHQAWLAAKPHGGPESEAVFDERFRAGVAFWKEYRIFQGPFVSQDFLHAVPPEFARVAAGF